MPPTEKLRGGGGTIRPPGERWEETGQGEATEIVRSGRRPRRGRLVVRAARGGGFGTHEDEIARGVQVEVGVVDRKRDDHRARALVEPQEGTELVERLLHPIPVELRRVAPLPRLVGQDIR